ncbi:MAG TPA: adenylate/guanylate cyclase domain-containing protein, partial [Leptospiraceae bacterium]|nr:adenylate/guanylate cyclase domain-containing protein [Leptospiraceae bacterium]
MIEKRLNEKKNIPMFFLYFNGCLETALPAVFIVFFSKFREHPIHALYTPPSFVFFIFVILSTLRLNKYVSIFTGIWGGMLYIGLALYFYDPKSLESGQEPILLLYQPHLIKGGFIVISGFLSGYVTSQIEEKVFNAFQLTQEKERIEKIFGEHVSPKVAEKLKNSDGEFTSETRRTAILFLDIRNFTGFSEDKSPEDVVQFLNTLFSFMVNKITENEGIINKYLGDGFMAVFGAPVDIGNPSEKALKAAKEICRQLKKEISLGKVPPVKIGIGIHSGNVVTGSIGSEERKEYTVIGDAVNLASRIEQLNKQYGSEILFSEDVWMDLKHKEGSDLGEITVKGRTQPVKIYKL